MSSNNLRILCTQKSPSFGAGGRGNQPMPQGHTPPVAFFLLLDTFRQGNTLDKGRNHARPVRKGFAMEWVVLLDADFAIWLREQDPGVQDAVAMYAQLLARFGPTLGRPQVDTLKGAKLTHLKELRVQHQGAPWRVLFAFDPKRQAILLVGGCKRGNKRWYAEAIALAEQRYRRHLEALEA